MSSPSLFLYNDNDWSEAQQLAMALGPKITAFLSILGSSYIVKEVLTDRKKRQRVFYRIMLGMSISDILSSSFLFLTTWAIPSNVDGLMWNIGTQRSCEMQGFFLQLGIMTPLYNGVLALCYYLSIYKGYRERQIRPIERYSHTLVILFGITTATVGQLMKLYNNANAWCWISPPPPEVAALGEQYRTTIRVGNNHNGDPLCPTILYRWLFWAVPVWAMIMWATISMYLSYSKVLQMDKKMNTYLSGVTSSVLKPSTRNVMNCSSRIIVTTAGPVGDRDNTLVNNEVSDTFRTHGGDQNDVETCEFTTDTPPVAATATTTTQSDCHVNAMPHEAAKRMAEEIERRAYYKSRIVASQGLFYIGAFLFVWIFPTIILSYLLANHPPPFICTFLVAFTTPFQGFLNFLVYIRPRALVKYSIWQRRSSNSNSNSGENSSNSQKRSSNNSDKNNTGGDDKQSDGSGSQVPLSDNTPDDSVASSEHTEQLAAA